MACTVWQFKNVFVLCDKNQSTRLWINYNCKERKVDFYLFFSSKFVFDAFFNLIFNTKLLNDKNRHYHKVCKNVCKQFEQYTNDSCLNISFAIYRLIITKTRYKSCFNAKTRFE